MPKPCSNDLRERVVKAVDAGQSCRSAALRFGVSPSSAIKWMERWRQRGDVSPGSSHGRIRSPLHAHRSWLLKLVTVQPDLTLNEVQQRLADRGVAIGIGSIKKNAVALRAGQARRRAQKSKLEKVSGKG